jgi:hypothetical protein
MTIDAPILWWRTTRAVAFSEAWPIDNAQNELQVLCGGRSLLTPHVFDDSSAAKGVASVSCLVLHTSVHFLRFEDCFAVAKGNMCARKPVVEQPEIVLTRGMPLVIGKATHSKMLSASFLADLQEDYERYGKGIFALMRERFPTKYFDALVSLAKVHRCWSSSWSR